MLNLVDSLTSLGCASLRAPAALAGQREDGLALALAQSTGVLFDSYFARLH